MSTFLKLVNGRPKGTTMVLTDLPSIANITFLGNISGSASTPSALTATQVTANLNLFTASLQGLTPASGGGTANFLRADGSWASPSGASPLTTKGDLYTFTTVNARHPVPADYGFLVPDSQQTDGWRNANSNQLNGRPGKNYIQYADFENNATTGWTLGTIGTLTNGLPTGSPTFGSGSSGNLSIAATSSSIEGAYSLNYVSSAATTQGDMVASSSYAIDSCDQAKVLTIKFYYTAASGASNANFSGTSSNSYAWAIYDVTNSSWLSSSGNFNLIQGTGSGYVTGTCQTNATTANIRLVVYNANATSGAATLTLDGFYVGPQTAPSGPAMTDLGNTPWTPTGAFTTNTTYTGSWARVGKYLSGKVLMVFAGAPNSVSSTINLPFTIDTSSMPTLTHASFGVGELTHSGTTYSIELIYNSTTSLSLVYQSAITGSQSAVTQAAPVTIASTDQIELSLVDIPILGWSSNTSMSGDTDTRVVAATAYSSAGISTTNGGIVKFPTVDFDTHAAYTASTGVYTVPISGIYEVSLAGIISNNGSLLTLTLFKNGSGSRLIVANTSTTVAASGIVAIKVNAGDTLDIRANGTAGISQSGTQLPIISFTRDSGPAVVTATESVNAGYFASGTTTPGAGGIINFDSKIFDSHNATTTGAGAWRYTAPETGTYQVNVFVDYNTGTSGAVELYKNGSGQQILMVSGSGAGSIIYGNATCLVKLNTGDFVDVRTITSFTITGAASAPYSTSIYIVRQGN